jgi:hypothetical protein
VDTTPGPDSGDGDPDHTGNAAPGSADAVGGDPSTGSGAPPEDDLADGDEDDEPVGSDPLRFNQWMKRSATGAVLSGIALGLQQALEPKRNLPAFVMEAPGEPEDPDAPITLHFDPDDPTKTVAVIRTPPGGPTAQTGAAAPDATEHDR